jgi:hypothetical protein
MVAHSPKKTVLQMLLLPIYCEEADKIKKYVRAVATTSRELNKRAVASVPANRSQPGVGKCLV